MPLQDVDSSTNYFEPPVWISMIGSTEILPLDCTVAKPQDGSGLGAVGLQVARKRWKSERKGDLSSAVPKPSFDPRIAPSSKFLMWFWVCLALAYLWNVLSPSTSPWASPLKFKKRPKDRLTRIYLWPRRCFRAMTTLALLAAVALTGGLAFIPLWLGWARLDWLNLGLMGLLWALAAGAAAGLAGTLFLDVFWFVVNDARVFGGKKLRYAPASSQWRVWEALLAFAVGLAALTVAAVYGLSLLEYPHVRLLFFFLTWSDIWNGISLFLPVQLLAATIVLLSHGMLLQMDLLDGVAPRRGANLIPRPAWPPQRDFDDPKSSQVVVHQILYPIATRFQRGKSIVLHLGALVVCSAWLVSLLLRTDFTELFSGWLCFAFILGCGYWGVRFVKTLEICHALARELRAILKSLEPRERYAVEYWRAVVARLGPSRRIGLRMFWQSRPHWNLKRGELSRAYRKFIDLQQRCGDDDPQMIESAENFYAMHVELYLRQMFVHLVALVTGLVVTAGLLFLTAQCFPFNSEPLLQLSTIVMLVSLAILILWYYLQFDRDELLSLFDGTEPDRVEWNWSLLRTTAPALALALVGLLSQAFPEMWVWLRGILQPLAHSTG
jgi:hypothetical protein